ncbi:radical SAM peptide maturase, CXXX-repeat target family [Abyssisolibacter fermentans]|uniref:radical SAM peptide maturase, CXXX-repeat target family n=1 Tax=Abyssisolibacter fermentans TaxID=1766203 RepID=UPI000831F88F|nr:radical SAM peptide maturase, CXXX-repeat target family [Abyssisolibacter fermentans]
MVKPKIKMGTLPPMYRDGDFKNITFCITEDCNLKCKYCYMVHKNSFKKMSFETAKKAVDKILEMSVGFDKDAVVWEFIGGEPFLEIDLIDKISDYIKLKTFMLDHPWFNNYRFSFSTNGLLYNTPKVQNYIKKNHHHLSMGISVDGNKTKHDLQRVKPNGEGSYDEVIKNVPLWQKQFPNASTKATFASDDLIHLKDSIISLWENGITYVAANVVFEDVWKDGDDEIFENQLKDLADYILQNELWNKYSVRFFDPQRGFPLEEGAKKANYCGAGKMLAVDCEGNLFPCLRFLDFTLNDKKGLSIGNIDTEINTDLVRPFEALSLETQSKEECINCEIASGCAWCTGYNYDNACTNTIYNRATHICKMHKANVRANEYFWTNFTKKTGIISPWHEEATKYKQLNKNIKEKTLQILLENNAPFECLYQNFKNNNVKNKKMDKDIVNKGLEFAKANDFDIEFLGKSEFIDSTSCNKTNQTSTDTYIVHKDKINNLSIAVKQLLTYNKKISIIKTDIETWSDTDIELYENELDKLVDILVENYIKDNQVKINILTERLYLNEMNNCNAGVNKFTLAPNGKIYICPAFYFNDEDNCIGNVDEGITMENLDLLAIDRAPICKECDAYSCSRCVYLNKLLTNEYNTPSKIQCVISHIERNASRKLQIELIKNDIVIGTSLIKKIDYLDPLDKILSKNKSYVMSEKKYQEVNSL